MQGQHSQHGTFSHAAPAQMDWSCHSDAVQPAPTSHFILRTVAWPASPWRSEEALLRSREGNLD